MSSAGKGYIGPEWRNLPKEEKARRLNEVEPLIAGRESWHKLSLQTKVPVDPLRRKFDPEWHRRRLARDKKYRDGNGGYRVAHTVDDPRSTARDVDIAARLAEIPPDTRSLTAYLFGDPLPGRRAIDRIGRHSE